MRALLAVAAAAVFALSCAGPRPSDPATRAARIEGRVWSPYCAGRLLAECSTAQARELRSRIAGRLEAGQSDDEVLRWLRTNYGDDILAAPEPAGSGAVIWLVPAALVAAGAALVAGLVVSWSRRRPDDPPHAPDAGTRESSEQLRGEIERGL